MARIQEMRGGKDYDADFATRMKGSGLWAELIGQRFRKAAARLGFNRERVDVRQLAVPAARAGRAGAPVLSVSAPRATGPAGRRPSTWRRAPCR